MSATRSSMAPDLPTFKEQGYDIELASLRGLAARRASPDVRDAWSRPSRKRRTTPNSNRRPQASMHRFRFLPPDQYANELKKTEAEFNALWKVIPWTDK
jgi:tripartite-type tricarboxylate transporter receptor subunit TctC